MVPTFPVPSIRWFCHLCGQVSYTHHFFKNKSLDRQNLFHKNNNNYSSYNSVSTVCIKTALWAGEPAFDPSRGITLYSITSRLVLVPTQIPMHYEEEETLCSRVKWLRFEAYHSPPHILSLLSWRITRFNNNIIQTPQFCEHQTFRINSYNKSQQDALFLSFIW
jgi:hypothetical protein